MNFLDNYKILQIKQKKELVEVFTDFETENNYEIYDSNNNLILYAAETDTNFLSRMFMKKSRPLTITIYDQNKTPLLKFKKPFKFFLWQIDILSPEGKSLGSIKQNFTMFYKKFTLDDLNPETDIKIIGPMLRPWTFKIKDQGEEVGKITKKWSGLGKEMFTDADNFGIEFGDYIKGLPRILLLGAVFLIDYLYFEE